MTQPTWGIDDLGLAAVVRCRLEIGLATQAIELALEGRQEGSRPQGQPATVRV